MHRTTDSSDKPKMSLLKILLCKTALYNLVEFLSNNIFVRVIMILQKVINKKQGTSLEEFSVFERFKAGFGFTQVFYGLILQLYKLFIF